jgi:PKD repeat protein
MTRHPLSLLNSLMALSLALAFAPAGPRPGPSLASGERRTLDTTSSIPPDPDADQENGPFQDSAPSAVQSIGLVGQIGEDVHAVFASGTRAYVGMGTTLAVLDVTDPSQPATIGQTDPWPDAVQSVWVAGDYAYVAAGESGLRIVRISNPAAPEEVDFYDTSGAACDVLVAGNYAYVAAGKSGLRILDISNPAHPTEANFYATGGSATGVDVVGNRAYVTFGFQPSRPAGGLAIVDVSEPAQPDEEGFVYLDPWAYSVDVQGNNAYVADDFGLRIVDVSNPAHPQEIASYKTAGWDEDVAVEGSYAYLAAGSGGLRVVDISDPRNPEGVSFYENTPGYAERVALAAGHVYVADSSGGLLILGPGSGKPWTLMFYFAHDNNLDETLDRFYKVLKKASENPNVNIVAFSDRNSCWPFRPQDCEAEYVMVRPKPQENITIPMGELTTDQPQTLDDFIRFATVNYPAAHYALIIQDHGHGLKGVAKDCANQEEKDWLGNKKVTCPGLDIKELRQALEPYPGLLDVLYLDACLMATVETAYELRDRVQYYVAHESIGWTSQDQIESYVNGKDGVAAAITSDTTPHDLAIAMAQSYADSVSSPSTVSVVDLSQIERVVDSANWLATELLQRQEETFPILYGIRLDVERFEEDRDWEITSSDRLCDLYDFANLVQIRIDDEWVKSAAADLIAALKKYIVAQGHWDGTAKDPDTKAEHCWSHANAHGVSIAFPPPDERSCYYSGEWLDFASGTDWGCTGAASAVPAASEATDEGWGAMLVEYLNQTNPSAPERWEPPDLVPMGTLPARVFLPRIECNDDPSAAPGATNHPPDTPSNPSPAEGRVEEAVHLNLNWTGGDLDGDAVTYDVVLKSGYGTPDQVVCDGLAATSCDPGPLNGSTHYLWQVIATDEHGTITRGPVWQFTAGMPANRPPEAPSVLLPADGAIVQGVETVLFFISHDPDGDQLAYDVYLEAGDSPPEVQVCEGVSTNWCDPGRLEVDREYVWQVVADDGRGGTARGPVWHFSTAQAANSPPYVPSNPSPGDGATDVTPATSLTWTGGDPDGDAVTYDVYLERDDSSPDDLLCDEISSTSCDPGALDWSAHYYWQVVASDEHDATTAGPVWELTVYAAPQAGFLASNPAVVSETIFFTNTTTGSEPLAYAWDFGDGGTSTERDPTHLYSAAGNYMVVLTATNTAGSSNWIDEIAAEDATWQARYWNNETLSGEPDLVIDEPAIGFDWGYSSPDPLIDADHFSSAFSRTLYFDEGTVRFWLYHDDGGRLWIDGTQYIDEWHRAVQIDQIEVPLTQGLHTIAVEHYEIDGAAALYFWWQLLSGPCDPASDGFVLYEQPSYQSRCLSFFQDSRDLGLVSFDDVASSSEFRGGFAGNYEITLYEQPDYGGGSSVLTASQPDLSASAFDDLASSLRVRPLVDRFEPDDTCTQAFTVTFDGSQLQHTCHNGDAADWVAFYAVDAYTYTIATLNVGPLAETTLTLYRDDCSTQIAYGYGGEGLDSLIIWPADASGWVYVKAQQFDGSSGPGRFYDVEVTYTSP